MTAQELLAAYAAGERNFSEADLSGADLRGANLYAANLGVNDSKYGVGKCNVIIDTSSSHPSPFLAMPTLPEPTKMEP